MTTRKGGGWFRTPNDVLRKHGHDLGPYGVSVFAVLAMYADANGICWPSQATIAKMLNISVPTVRTNTRLLIGFGLVRIVGKGGRGRSTRYQIVAPIYGEDSKPRLLLDANPVSPIQTQQQNPTRAERTER